MADVPVVVEPTIDPKDSILTSIKKLLGIAKAVTTFDIDIIIYINSILAILSQVRGDAPVAFLIADDTGLWSEYLGDIPNLEFIKMYVFLKVRVLFDPPATAALLESTNKLIEELEFRVFVETDPAPIPVVVVQE